MSRHAHFDIEPLNILGARVRNLDLTRTSPRDTGDFRAALWQYGLLCVQGSAWQPEDLARFAAALGPLEIVRPRDHRAPNSNVLRLQSNIPGLGVNGGGHYWHADGSWQPSPPVATVLGCQQAPSRGGETAFTDAAGLWDRLDRRRQRQLLGLVGTYPNRAILAADLKAMKVHDDALGMIDDARHPLVRNHRVTGRRALILNEQWLSGLEDMNEPDARHLLADLSSLLDGPVVHEHRWAAGDVLLWDNERVLHRARPIPDGTTKVTLRAIIAEWPRNPGPPCRLSGSVSIDLVPLLGLPAQVVGAESRRDLDDRLFVDEQAPVRHAAPERQAEFRTVRVLARRALSDLGVASAPIGRAPDGNPVWPMGLIGSMTHCTGYRVAVVARATDVAALGIDAEPHLPLPDGVADLVISESEREVVGAVSGRFRTLCRPADIQL